MILSSKMSMNHIMHNTSARRDFSRRAILYNTPSKHHPNVRIVKGDVFMEQQKIIDELNYYKAQAITELLYARDMITFDEYDKLTDLNRQTFSPLYADLLPKSLEKSSNKS